ncbi:MAG: GspE/PulE family protein [bacterium]|nr:GspE/PulE family protein [bacterium]
MTEKGGDNNNELVKRALLDGSYLSETDFTIAEQTAIKNNQTLMDYVLDEEIVSKPLLGQAIAEIFHTQFVDLERQPTDSDTVHKIPEELAKQYKVVLVSQTPSIVTLASSNPSNSNLPSSISSVFPGKRLRVGYAFQDDIDQAFAHYKKSLDTQFSQTVESQTRVAPELLKSIFDDAIAHFASDIHFEPIEDQVHIRFRIDGVLQEAGKISRNFYENMVNRIKVQSGLRIDEHAAAQDGSMQYEGETENYDFRVSIIPTVAGEKVALRVLKSYIKGLSLNDLGLTDENQELIKKAREKPFGMIVTVGPTGAGKTTTLYAVLKEINKPGINVTTIEDPVEYKMKGINQIQVNNLTDLTFAKGLRSIVRQDPDVILVGEIRDEETAEIAINAALTGHIMLTTFHANDAATAIPRLLDSGVEPFLLASTLEVIISQRLLRKICEHCRYSTKQKMKDANPVEAQVMKKYFKQDEITIYKGKGCAVCNHTGYRGRTAIFEVLPIDGEIQDLILTNPSKREIWTLAKKHGAKTLFEDGILKVRSGITTIEEVTRVAEDMDIKVS